MAISSRFEAFALAVRFPSGCRRHSTVALAVRSTVALAVRSTVALAVRSTVALAVRSTISPPAPGVAPTERG